MLKSTRWICWRCALHWTTQIATAIASAARGPKSAAPASAPTALTEIEPSSSSSASASPTLTSAITASSPITSVDVPKSAPSDARRDAEERHEADEQAEPGRELEEARAAGRVGRVAALLLRQRLRDARERLAVVAVLRHGDEAGAAVGRHQQRLGAGAEDAVAALELRAVDGEVGLVDERVRVLRVLRVAGDADRDGRADRLARRLDVVQALGDRAADPLGDLERLLRRRLRQEDRELLAAEPGRDVVVAQLGAEDLGDALQHRVAGEMAVGVVDLAQQVEVGHDQRHRPLEALRAAELLRQRRREVARVEEAGLRVDARLGLELRHRRAPGGSAAAVRSRTGRATALPVQKAASTTPSAAKTNSVERVWYEKSWRIGCPLTQRIIGAISDELSATSATEAAVPASAKRTSSLVIRPSAPLTRCAAAPRRHRRDREDEDVERLDVPGAAAAQPLRHVLDQRQHREQRRRQQQHRRDQEDAGRVVALVARRPHDEELRQGDARREDRELEPVARRLIELREERSGDGDRDRARRRRSTRAPSAAACCAARRPSSRARSRLREGSRSSVRLCPSCRCLLEPPQIGRS